MDDLAVILGRQRVMGCPYHGLIRGSQLTLANGTTIDDRWFADGVRGSYRVAVPGVVPVVRESAEVAADTLAGYEWRTDAVMHLRHNDQRLELYGRKSFEADALYAQAVGNCWAVKLPTDRAMLGGKTGLVQAATLARFGALSFTPVADVRPVAVTLSGYSPIDSQDYPRNDARTWDSLPDGSQVILGGWQHNARYERHVPRGAFDLLHISGTGDAGSPFAVTLEKLSNEQTGVATQVDNFVSWSGVVRWVPQDVEEFIPPIDSSADTSDWLKYSVTGSTLTIDPAGIPSAMTPSLSFVSGTREAKFLGHVIGWWFVDGVPQPVTEDVEYTLTAEWEINASSTASTPQVTITKYDSNGPVAPANGGSYSFEPGVFVYSGTLVRATTERLTRRLKVGGVLIDSAELVYEDRSTRVLSGAENVGGHNNFHLHLSSGYAGGPVTTATWVRRLLVDGVEIDQATVNEAGDTVGFGETASWWPTRALDDANRFSGLDPTWYWLPSLRGGRLPDDVAAVSWSCAPHWWSNHLVCLRRAQSTVPSYMGLLEIYGPTAYPGGVVAGSINAPAPSPSANALPVHGSRNPLMGTVLLGQPNKVIYL